MRKLPATPANHRLYVVGDIHGRYDLLSKLIELIEMNAAKHPKKIKKLIFLGDYVDRGLDSHDVIERLTQPFAEKIEPHFLRGNHEELFIQILNNDFRRLKFFLHYGGEATLASYGVQCSEKMDDKIIVETTQKFVNAFPKHHMDFLEKTKFHIEFGDYYFVHAGVRPGTPLEAQTNNDKLWIRQEFIPHKEKFEKMIIHGHTISDKPDVQINRIGIDTGAYATGQLTCLVLDGTKRMMMQT